MFLETDHGILWVGLFMGHLQQLLRSAHTHLTEDIKPPTAQRHRGAVTNYTTPVYSDINSHMLQFSAQ